MVNDENDLITDEDDFNPMYETDTYSFSKKGAFDKASLVMMAVQNCFNKRAVELRAGYKTHILDKDGNAFPKIIADTRKPYVGAVIALTNLLRFELASREDWLKKVREFESSKVELKEKYIYRECNFYEKDGNIITEPIKNGRAWMPENGEALPYPFFLQIKKNNGTMKKILRVESKPGIWDNQVNLYWDEMIDLCDFWFGELNGLISGDLKNYKSIGGF